MSRLLLFLGWSRKSVDRLAPTSPMWAFSPPTTPRSPSPRQHLPGDPIKQGQPRNPPPAKPAGSPTKASPGVQRLADHMCTVITASGGRVLLREMSAAYHNILGKPLVKSDFGVAKISLVVEDPSTPLEFYHEGDNQFIVMSEEKHPVGAGNGGGSLTSAKGNGNRSSASVEKGEQQGPIPGPEKQPEKQQEKEAGSQALQGPMFKLHAPAPASVRGKEAVKVFVFWDIENCPVPSSANPENVGPAIVNALRIGPARISAHVQHLAAYGNIVGLTAKTREALHRTGVTLVDVPHGPSKNATDFALLTDLMLVAVDHPPPCVICVVANDSDYAQALHKLKQRGYEVFLFCRGKQPLSPALKSACSHFWDWDHLVRL